MAWSDTVLALTPWAWYRLGDADFSEPADSSGNGNTGTTFGSVTYGEPSLVPSDATDACIYLTGNRGILSASTPFVFMGSGDAFSFAVTYKAELGWLGAGLQPMFRWADFDIYLAYATNITISVAGTLLDTGVAAATLQDGSPHIVAAMFKHQSQKLWIDGELVFAGTVGIPNDEGGSAARFGETNSSNYANGWYDEAILAPNAEWTDADVTSLYTAWSGASGPAPIPTDTSLGYGYDGYGEVGDNLIPAGIPAGIHLAPIRRVHHSLPAPTLVDGRPT